MWSSQCTFAMSNPPNTLILLPSSPSPSELDIPSDTSEPEDEAGERRILGVRELAELSKIKSKRPVRHTEIAILGHPDDRERDAQAGQVGRDKDDVTPFARDVCIKGWRVVGGKTWTDKAKVGAYVGECFAGLLTLRGN